MGNWIDFMFSCVRWVCVCFHCCDVFSKLCILHSQCGSVLFSNAFLQRSRGATLDAPGDCVRVGRSMQCCVLLCSVGCVLDVWRGRDYDDAGRLEVSVMSSDVRWVKKSERKVLLVVCDETEGISC